MENEPVLFIQEAGKPAPSGHLLFTPSAPPTIRSPDFSTTYEAGKDFVWKPGSDTIELTPSSRIPFKTSEQMAPPAGSPQTLNGVLWSEGRFFHDLQAQVTYTHSGAWAGTPTQALLQLPRSLAKLKAKQSIKLVALGDSITEGFNASGFKPTEAPPFQPSYPQLVANTLQQRFGSPVTLSNLARRGTRADWGLTQVDKVAAEKPDLIIIAFGMNHRESAPDFEGAMRKLLSTVQAGSPSADVILVAPMTQRLPAEKFRSYRDALRNLAGENVALADVTTPWMEILKRKPFSDLSGNNVNHPNDFGHRLYAQIICELFSPAMKK